MRTVEVSANELTDTKVAFVSLVKRGANRIPFRITKSEGDPGMLNLSSLFKREAPAPAVSAILVNKGVDMDAVHTHLTASGFSVANAFEQDGVMVFPQGGSNAPLEDAVIIKMDEDVAVACVNVTKGFVAYDNYSTSFKEMMGQQGFYPSVHTAMDVLMETVRNCMYNAGNPAEAKAAVTAAIGDFQTYVEGLLSSVPVMAFKMEGGIKVEKTAEIAAEAAPAAPAAPAVEAPKTEEANDASVLGGTVPEEGAPENQAAEAPAEAPVEGAHQTDAPSADLALEVVVRKTVEDMMGGLTAALGEQIAALTKTVEGKVTSLSARVEDAVALAKSAEEAVTGMVPGTTSGDRPQNNSVAKSDGEFRHFDTAYGRPE